MHLFQACFLIVEPIFLPVDILNSETDSDNYRECLLLKTISFLADMRIFLHVSGRHQSSCWATSGQMDGNFNLCPKDLDVQRAQQLKLKKHVDLSSGMTTINTGQSRQSMIAIKEIVAQGVMLMEKFNKLLINDLRANTISVSGSGV